MNLSRHRTQSEGASSSFSGSSLELSQNGFCTWESLALASHFRIGELARVCHVSVRTLQRHFQKHYDLTVSEWLHERRLEQARPQLATAESIKAVAYALGYKQSSHFTRDFKQHFGVPPSLWRVTGVARGTPIAAKMQDPPIPEKQSEFRDLFNSVEIAEN